jgi:hypothetical protein
MRTARAQQPTAPARQERGPNQPAGPSDPDSSKEHRCRPPFSASAGRPSSRVPYSARTALTDEVYSRRWRGCSAWGARCSTGHVPAKCVEPHVAPSAARHRRGDSKRRVRGRLSKPSSGLEPETPSLPWTNGAVRASITVDRPARRKAAPRSSVTLDAHRRLEGVPTPGRARLAMQQRPRPRVQEIVCGNPRNPLRRTGLQAELEPLAHLHVVVIRPAPRLAPGAGCTRRLKRGHVVCQQNGGRTICWQHRPG